MRLFALVGAGWIIGILAAWRLTLILLQYGFSPSFNRARYRKDFWLCGGIALGGPLTILAVTLASLVLLEVRSGGEPR